MDPEKKKALHAMVNTWLSAPEGRRKEAIAARIRLMQKMRREAEDPHSMCGFEIPCDRKIM